LDLPTVFGGEQNRRGSAICFRDDPDPPALHGLAGRQQPGAEGIPADGTPVTADMTIQKGVLGLAAIVDRVQGGGSGNDVPELE